MINVNPSKKFIIVFEGKEYPAHRPKIGAQADFEEKMEDAKTSGKGLSKLMIEYLVTCCGMTEEVVREFDADQLTEVVTAMQSSKKN